VRRCDLLVALEAGKVTAHGTYEQRLERSASFRKIATIIA
jgi:hypothetical protein